MKTNQEATLLRIFTGSTDKTNHIPLYEFLVQEAKAYGLAGATVLRGVMGFGATSVVHSVKLFDISEDIPMVVEIVDSADKIEAFVAHIEPYFAKLKFGVLVTTEKVNVISYRPTEK